MVIVQFESVAALERAEEIVAVDGVDMVLVGLNDLLADLFYRLAPPRNISREGH